MLSNQIETRSNKHLRIKHSNKKQLNTELSELPSLNSVHKKKEFPRKQMTPVSCTLHTITCFMLYN